MNEHDVFMAAVQIEGPSERSAYLDQACGDESGLRLRVEALLKALQERRAAPLPDRSR